ncbi:MAG: hypothetical protein K6E99_00085 [Bacilli bacterium]|nr:hypothetical protein [Bacilli bacterium]
MKHTINIHDVYYGRIYVTDNVKYTNFETLRHARFLRYGFIVKNKEVSCIDGVTYFDLISNNKIKADLGNCETGEELVDVSSKEYVPLIEWLNLPIDCTKYNKTTRKELLCLIRKHFESLEYIKDNSDKVVLFDDVKDKVSQKPKVRNKLICRVMKLKDKNKKGDK